MMRAPDGRASVQTSHFSRNSCWFPRGRMANRRSLESSRQDLLDITLVPAVAHLPVTVPAERRDVIARHALLCRILREFEEMPGLSLTPIQAAKFFGLRSDTTTRILGRLTDASVLRQRRDGQFMLRA